MTLKAIGTLTGGQIALKERALVRRMRIPELETPENSRWLALLIDTEGILGWIKLIKRMNRADEYRYEYVYRIPYLGSAMNELESKQIIDNGAKLVGVHAYTRVDLKTGKPIRYFKADFGRGLSTIEYMDPYLIKFKRLANLCLILFKYHTLIPIEKFDMVIETLFGKYITPKQANLMLLKMTEAEHRELIRKARELTSLHLKLKRWIA
jgi:hypothetical protein